MLSIFKSDPTKNLHKRYHLKLEQAMVAQRRGDIKSYSMITADAEKILEEIEKSEPVRK